MAVGLGNRLEKLGCFGSAGGDSKRVGGISYFCCVSLRHCLYGVFGSRTGRPKPRLANTDYLPYRVGAETWGRLLFRGSSGVVRRACGESNRGSSSGLAPKISVSRIYGFRSGRQPRPTTPHCMLCFCNGCVNVSCKADAG